MGASMFAATAAGLYDKVEDAMHAMGQGFDAEYHPNQDNVAYYENRYNQYRKLGGFIEAQTRQSKANFELTTS
jgi:L-ribulokinase